MAASPPWVLGFASLAEDLADDITVDGILGGNCPESNDSVGMGVFVQISFFVSKIVLRPCASWEIRLPRRCA
jgi:hypothetical protein